MGTITQHRNQQGFTLVELLATFTILFVVLGLLFAVLNNSLQFFRKESERIDVRQEVNIIANQITTFYKENGDVTLTNNADGSVTITSSAETREYAIPNHEIRITCTPTRKAGNYELIDITIIISGEESFTLNTTVSRIIDSNEDTAT